MRLDRPIDQIIHDIHALDRAGCINTLRAFQQPQLDFTDAYLQEMSLDQLRHVLMAACIQARRGVGHRRAS